MTPVFRAFPLLAVTLFAIPAAAQSVSGPSTAAPAQGVTSAQFIARHVDHFMAADKDGDGKVSLSELEASGRGKRKAAHLFQQMDANHDGFVDRNEAQAYFAQRFQHLDRNGDGVLEPNERHPAKGAAARAEPATVGP